MSDLIKDNQDLSADNLHANYVAQAAAITGRLPQAHA